MNTKTADLLDPRRAGRAHFEARSILPGGELAVRPSAQIIAADGEKQLFCRLPGVVQLALQARLTGGGRSPAD